MVRVNHLAINDGNSGPLPTTHRDAHWRALGKLGDKLSYHRHRTQSGHSTIASTGDRRWTIKLSPSAAKTT
jgi:hypothetical protein